MFKEVLAACIAISTMNTGTAAQIAAQTTAPGAQAKAGVPCVLPSVADSVDLQEVPGTDLVTVPVEINDQSKHFLLDIGTNPDEVSQATVSGLSLPLSNSSTDSIPLAPGVDQSQNQFHNFNQNTQLQAAMFDVGGSRSAEDYRPRVRVASFTMGSATGRGLQFVIAKDEEMGRSKSKPYDGLLTGDFFRQYDVELDFVKMKLNYLTPTTCTDPDQVVFWPHTDVAIIPMMIEDGKIHAQVTIQGHVIDAVIDTSSDQTVMRRGLAEQTLGFKANTPDMMPDGDHDDGMGQQIYRHTFSQISFAGGVTAINVPALIQSYSMVRDLHRQPVLGSRAQFAPTTSDLPDLTLGMDVLQQLHLYIVPGQKNIHITSAK